MRVVSSQSSKVLKWLNRLLNIRCAMAVLTICNHFRRCGNSLGVRLPATCRPCLPVQGNQSGFNYTEGQIMTRLCGAGSPQLVSLLPELLERIDRYADRLEAKPHLSVSCSDALRRLLTLDLEDAEDADEAEAIRRSYESRMRWEKIKAESAASCRRTDVEVWE
jgi:hypothetical protein